MIQHRHVAVSNGKGKGLYSDEVCEVGSCCRPPGHKGTHDQFGDPKSPDSVPLHALDALDQESNSGDLDRLLGALTDAESTAVLTFVRSELGGPRIHKVGAAAVLMLQHANLHDAADAVTKLLMDKPDVQRLLEKGGP